MNGSPSQEGQRALAAALRYLLARDRTQHEVARHLRRKGFSDQAAQEAMEKLRGWGYLDDARVALQWAQARAQQSLWGPARLAAELERRGIERGIVWEVLARLRQENPECELALQAARKYMRTHSRAGCSMARRLAAHLARRGFSPGVIREALRRELQEETPGQEE